MKQLHKPSVAYASTSLASGMMHSVFMFYYVKVFLNRYHVSEPWFQASQVVYMIWNAINDPLFGYFQDNFEFSWVKTRRHSVLYGAPFFAVSFLVPWFAWADYEDPSNGWIVGIHLMFSLCFYDTLFTFVLLAQCALFTEMSPRQEDRIRLVRYSQVASLIGSSSVFLCELISENQKYYRPFQVACVVIAVVSWWFLRYTGMNADTEYDVQGKKDKELLLDDLAPPLPAKRSPSDSVLRLTWQIVKEVDFLAFVFMNFCQIYHATFLANFTNIICDNLISNDFLPSGARSAFYGAMFLLPQVIVILGTPLVSRVGYYRVIMGSFMLKIGWGIGMYMIGKSHVYLLTFFFLLETVSANGIFSLFNLCLSDVIDNDIEKHNRQFPLSSMVFGTNALITKPAISMAPMLVVWIFNKHGYSQLKDKTNMTTTTVNDLNEVMFTVTCLTPVIVGFLEILIWSRYTIRDSHQSIPKHTEVE